MAGVSVRSLSKTFAMTGVNFRSDIKIVMNNDSLDLWPLASRCPSVRQRQMVDGCRRDIRTNVIVIQIPPQRQSFATSQTFPSFPNIGSALLSFPLISSSDNKFQSDPWFETMPPLSSLTLHVERFIVKLCAPSPFKVKTPTEDSDSPQYHSRFSLILLPSLPCLRPSLLG